MPAPKKNNFWMQRSTHGRSKIFKTPKILEKAAYQYFEWSTNNPLKEQKVFGSGKRMTVKIMRAFTLKGLFIFLDIDSKTWDLYKVREDFIPITTKIQEIIYTQKFEGAAAGLLKENIIARELGLKDHSDITTADESLNKGYYDYLMQRRTKKEK